MRLPRAALALASLGSLAGLGAGIGAASASGPSTFARVGGPGFVPGQATALGTLDPATALNVDVVLQSQDPTGLSAYATAVSSPGSPDFRHFLTTAQFAARFGAGAGAIAAVERGLAADGLTVGATSANGLVVHLAATAGVLARSWDTSFESYRLEDGATGFADARAPAFSPALAPLVSGVVGLDSLASETSLAIRAPRTDSATAPPVAPRPADLRSHVLGPQPTTSCAAAISSASASYPNATLWSEPEIGQAYGFDDLYGAGDLGAGVTVALIEFAPYLSNDITAFENCFSPAPAPTITNEAVDGGSGSPGSDSSGEEEAELDLETVIGLAPEANIDVYEGPQNASLTATLDTFTAAVDNPAVNVISTSWGECEPALDATLTSGESTLFEQAATEGKTIVAAAGDEGSEDCDGSLRGQAGEALAVDDPAAQPYVTGVGGTYLSAIGTPPTETVWNGNDGDGLSGAAGGGGVSSLWQMPSYQADAPSSLGVVTANSACASGGGNCREVPDVSANAGAYVAIYCSETGREGCASGGWTGFGGTSVAAPTWGALFALADASTACGGSAVGFANPALYAIAGGSGYASAFNDITSGNNDLLGVHGGLYPATSGDDLASGLGTPIAGSGSGTDTGLVSQLCAIVRPTSFAGASPSSAPTTTTATTVAVASTPTTVAPSSLPAPGPTVTRVSPNAGPTKAGTLVTITGTRFTEVKTVRFGSKRASSFTVKSKTKIVARAPAGSGVVNVVVTAASLTSTTTSSTRFTYLRPPTVRSVSPSTGPTKGGTKVTISGSGFTRVSAVRFGPASAKSFRIVSSRRIVATSPTGTRSIEVTVTTPGGTSAGLKDDDFRYT